MLDKNMNDKLPIDTLSKVIKLRNTLDKISQISWSFSQLNKNYPVSMLTAEDAVTLIQEYQSLIEEGKDLLSRQT